MKVEILFSKYLVSTCIKNFMLSIKQSVEDGKMLEFIIQKKGYCRYIDYVGMKILYEGRVLV